MANHASILQHLSALNPTPLMLGGQRVECTWNPDPTDPIIETNRVLLVLPDMHIGDGGSADIFRGSAAAHIYRDRLERFLRGVVNAKVELEATGFRLSTVQLGDFYDVWRAYPFAEDERGRTYAAINREYASCLSLLIDDLDCRFCVGNHDGILAHYPPDWAFAANARLAYSQRFCKGRLFCFHGHQGDQIADRVAGQDGRSWVALGSVLSCVCNSAGMALQQAIDAVRDSNMSADGGWVDGSPPEDGRFHAPRWADYGGKPRRFLQLLDGMAATATPLADVIRMIIVGHTHRPGIAWLSRANRTIPIVDVGSWTYGRSQFALATEGQITVYEL